jgi:hypothetical protein
MYGRVLNKWPQFMEVATTANLDPTSILSIEGVAWHRY